MWFNKNILQALCRWKRIYSILESNQLSWDEILRSIFRTQHKAYQTGLFTKTVHCGSKVFTHRKYKGERKKGRNPSEKFRLARFYWFFVRFCTPKKDGLSRTADQGWEKCAAETCIVDQSPISSLSHNSAQQINLPQIDTPASSALPNFLKLLPPQPGPYRKWKQQSALKVVYLEVIQTKI